MTQGLTDAEALIEYRKDRYRILVCVDGSDESYRGLQYAARLGAAPDADIVLLYVRPIDQGMRTGGLQVRVARENMLNWGLELPGIQYLKKGRDMLVGTEELASQWEIHSAHTDVVGDPLGDNKIEYTNNQGKSIVLKLKTASSVAVGILDQYELGPYNLIILGSSGRAGGFAKNLWDPAIAEKVAIHAPCSVCVARELETGHGMLLCTDGSDQAMEMINKAAQMSTRVGAAVSILSVSLDDEGEVEARENVNKAAELLRSLSIEPRNILIEIGNPVEQIIEAAKTYTFVVIGDTGRTGLKRFFMGSVAFKVMEFANNSVMIVR